MSEAWVGLDGPGLWQEDVRKPRIGWHWRPHEPNIRCRDNIRPSVSGARPESDGRAPDGTDDHQSKSKDTPSRDRGLARACPSPSRWWSPPGCEADPRQGLDRHPAPGNRDKGSNQDPLKHRRPRPATPHDAANFVFGAGPRLTIFVGPGSGRPWIRPFPPGCGGIQPHPW